MFLRSVVLLATVLITAQTSAHADTLRIASWNVKAGSAENLLLRREGLKAAGKRLRPDLLILQEINSFASVQVIKDAMGIIDAEIAISNFGSDADKVFFGFELAVISKVPIVKVEEWQVVSRERGKEFPDPNGPIRISRTGEITTTTTDEKHVLVVPSDVIKNREARKARVPRGVLRVELENGLVIYPVHLKSNGTALCRVVKDDVGDAFRALNKIGEAVPSLQTKTEAAIQDIRKFTRGRDNPNSLNSWKVQERFPAFAQGHLLTAQQRENGVAFIAKLAAKDIAANKTVIVAGDFNTPLNEPSKTGKDLSNDCVPEPLTCERRAVPDTCGGKDGFDDTLRILSGGIVPGVELRPLFTKAEPTYVSKNKKFARSPIDNIYIGGRLASDDLEAELVKESDTSAFGSDHHPLLAVLKAN